MCACVCLCVPFACATFPCATFQPSQCPQSRSCPRTDLIQIGTQNALQMLFSSSRRKLVAGVQMHLITPSQKTLRSGKINDKRYNFLFLSNIFPTFFFCFVFLFNVKMKMPQIPLIHFSWLELFSITHKKNDTSISNAATRDYVI